MTTESEGPVTRAEWEKTVEAMASLSKRLDDLAVDPEAMRARIRELEAQVSKGACFVQEAQRANRQLREKLEGVDAAHERTKHAYNRACAALQLGGYKPNGVEWEPPVNKSAVALREVNAVLDAFQSINVDDLVMVSSIVSLSVPENKRMRDWLDRVKAALTPAKAG